MLRLFGVSVSVLVYAYVLCVLCMSGYMSAEITEVRVCIKQNIKPLSHTQDLQVKS